MEAIPYGKQHIDDSDIEAVVAVLRSDFLTQGPKVAEFEKKFSHAINTKYSSAVSNGTAALHLAALCLNIKPGDKVIVPTLSFVASANCIRYVGGEVIFADIDPETFLISYESVIQLLDRHGSSVKGIVLVDFAGRPIIADKFWKLAQEKKLWVIEDACHAPGAKFKASDGKWHNSGNGDFADLAAFSFHPVKHIACGEGGMLTTNNNELDQQIRLLRSHGITKNKDDFENTSEPEYYYEMQELGYNYRLTDIQSALGISQLVKLNSNIEKRNHLATLYAHELKDLPIDCPQISKTEVHAFHLYVVKMDRRNEVYEFLRQHNIFCQVHYIPIHIQPYYARGQTEKYFLPHAEKYYEKCLSLPLYPTLSENHLSFVIDKLKLACKKFQV